MLCWRLQRLKLFDKLEINSKSVHVKKKDCCSAPLNNEEVEMLDECFELVGSLTEIERSSLYFIAGYVAKKETLCVSNDNEDALTLLVKGCTDTIIREGGGGKSAPTPKNYNNHSKWGWGALHY